MRAAKKSTSKPKHQGLKCPFIFGCDKNATRFYRVKNIDDWEEGSSSYWCSCKFHGNGTEDIYAKISRKEYLAGMVLEL